MSACDTCAFRPGSTTHDNEPYNALRGLLCALGGRPFHCHMLNGEDHHDDEQYMLQRLPRVRAFLRNLPELRDSKILEGETLKLCEGWKEAVREHKANGLFDDPAVRRVRRIAADRALEVIELFIAAPDGSLEKAEYNRELGSLVHLLAAPSEPVMTCIVGMIDGDEVAMGGDSAAVDQQQWHMETMKAGKVFTRGDYIIGYTSSFRMGQLLQYQLEVPDRLPDSDTMEWMSTHFVDAVRKCFSEGDWQQKDKERAEGGTFLVGHDARIFIIESDYQVREAAQSFNAVGGGSPFAIGALHALTSAYAERLWRAPAASVPEFDVGAAINTALATAERFSAGVRGPFTILRGGKRLEET